MARSTLPNQRLASHPFSRAKRRGVEQMAVADIVRSQREANPHVHRQLGIEPVDELMHVLHASMDAFTRILEIDKSQLPPRPRHHLHQALRADPTDGFGIEFGFLVQSAR